MLQQQSRVLRPCRRRSYALLLDYDWFWRLDSDSFLLARPVDPFLRLARDRLVYGYLGVGREDAYLTTGTRTAHPPPHRRPTRARSRLCTHSPPLAWSTFPPPR